MNKKGAKIIASMLVFVMMFTYMSIVGEVVATSVSTLTNNENVEFDAYLKEDDAKTYAAIKKIGEENYLYSKITVKNAGYLKKVDILFDNPNFEIPQDYTSSDIAKVEKNKITLNQINSGKTVELAIPINFIQKELVKQDDLRKDNKVSLSATYVDGNGKEKEIAKDLTVTLGWTSEKEAMLDMQVSKFIPYEINGKKGVMLQTILNTGLKDNVLPIKSEKIEISVPMIDNIKPETITVVPNTTKSINGEEEVISFTSENYAYSKEEGKLTITVENKENENKEISWKKDAKDEYVITYVYPENTEIKEDGVQIEFAANVELKVFEAELTTATRKIERQQTLKDQIGTLVDFEIVTNIEKTSKGQIYANYDVSKKVPTVYEEKITADVTMSNLIDTLIIDLKEDSFVNTDDTKLSAQNDTYYKQIVIEKSNFDKILSEDGSIKIYNGETLITTIDKSIAVNEEGKIIVDLTDANVSRIRLETSDVKAEGKLEITSIKELRGNLSYTLDKMKNTKALELNATLTANSSNVKVAQLSKEKQIALTEPTTNAEITIEPANLSTIVANNNVKIKAALKTDTLDCKLYKNPTLNIVLPKYIENINVKNVEVLFETEGTKLTLKENKLLQNADGTKTLQIVLDGTQTEYSLGSVSKGLNVVVTADIIVNKFTPNKEENIVMNYTNNYINKEEKQAVAKVNFVAPTGIVAMSSVLNYKDNAEVVTNVNSETKVATIPTMQKTRNVRFEMNLINNYSNTIDNISILGRVPFKANTDASSSVSLGTTFDMNLVNALSIAGVDTSKVKVYYSVNGNATKDLTNATNGWTETVEDFSKVKSYLIVLQDYILNTGDGISFAYDAKLPENLQHNESAYQSYVVYFNNNLQSGTISDKASSKIGVTTGKGAVLEANITSSVEEIKELTTDDIFTYKITVKNTGTETAKNVKASIVIPENLSHIELDEESIFGYNTITTKNSTAIIELGTIEPSKAVEKEIMMIVGRINEDIIKTNLKAVITTDSIQGEISSNTVSNTLVKSYYNVTTSIKNNISNLKVGDSYEYDIYVSSDISYLDREETKVEITLPQELEYEGLKVTKESIEDKVDITKDITSKYDKKTRKLTIDLKTLEKNTIDKLELKVKVGNLEENVYSKELKLDIKVSGKDVRTKSVETEAVEVNRLGFKISQTSTITENAEISNNEDFKYIFTIENLSNLYIYDAELTDLIPQGVRFKNARVIYSGFVKDIYEVDENGQLNIKLNFNPKETIKVEIDVIADMLNEDKTITNSAQIKYQNVNYATSNSITHIVKKFEAKQEEVANETKRIMGQVWEDENRDGIKDENEFKVEGVELLLFNNETGKLVVDETGKELRVRTDADGIYTFSGIEKGRYTVIFLYDTANYSATTYRKENVDATKNSDAIDTKITIDGVTRLAAITEEIVLSDTNSYNIDLGLVENAKFDLKLDKTVSKITVQDNEQTKVYEYKDEKLAKRDLVGKKVNETTIVVEYKIKVTNEGAVPGYVKKIVDYIPKEMKFSSELNRDWYSSTNGDIYNSSLANTIINPGETKEVTLILSKKMTEDTLGLINNTAEIYEAYNDLGLEDVDSKQANKVSEEDDMSAADVLITIKTGETIMFIGLSLTIITILGVGAYFIKKKVLI